MAEQDLIRLTLWLKPQELRDLQRLLIREAKEHDDTGMLVLAEYLTAAVEQREGVH